MEMASEVNGDKNRFAGGLIDLYVVLRTTGQARGNFHIGCGSNSGALGTALDQFDFDWILDLCSLLSRCCHLVHP